MAGNPESFSRGDAMATEPEYGPAGTQHVPPPVDPPPYTTPHQAPYAQPTYTAQTGGGLASNVAAGLAYITCIPAIIFLVLDPYKRDPLVRFHSWQSIFFTIFAIVLRVAEGFLWAVLPGMVMVGLGALISLALFAIWLIAIIQAFQGRTWQIPIIGGFAAQQASSRPVM